MSEERALARRRVVLGTATVAVGSLAGCLGSGDGGGSGCESGEVTVEAPDGTTHCVVPVESDQSVQEYYGYGRDSNDSASTPEELAANDATVLFLYRSTATGEHSLVVINGDATASTDGGGNVAMTFEGVSGYEWQVQDGPAGSGGGDRDPYTSPSGEFGDSESVIWGWDDSRTDGGAFGPLGETFDITVVHQAEGAVGGQTQSRMGLDRLLLVDGSDPGNYIQLAEIDDERGDISVRVHTG